MSNPIIVTKVPKKRGVKKSERKEPTDNTKLSKILLQRGLSQKDLVDLVKTKSNMDIEKYRISKIITGQIFNYRTSTCRAIANALDVKMEDILED